MRSPQDFAKISGKLPESRDAFGPRLGVYVRCMKSHRSQPDAARGGFERQYHAVASNDTAAGRAQNRRTDLLIRPTH
jgi:hypothetical protein